ncbi:MAG: ribonuclease III [Treponema sp.]|nr:ribonuclease III [Treponema sp.]
MPGLEVPVPPDRKKALQLFSKSLCIRFKSPELLNLSLTHRSASNESGLANNERLEFLGDAILGAVSSSLLYSKFPGKNEGELAKIKAVVVSEEILSGLALELRIDKLLILGKGEELSGGRTKKAILADALEALIGALYLDSGFKAAGDFIRPLMEKEIEKALNEHSARDYKSLLQELTQRLYRNYPVYRLVKRSGPEHERLFWIELTVNGKNYGPCTGRSKKAAEQEAAKLACGELENLV